MNPIHFKMEKCCPHLDLHWGKWQWACVPRQFVIHAVIQEVLCHNKGRLPQLHSICSLEPFHRVHKQWIQATSVTWFFWWIFYSSAACKQWYQRQYTFHTYQNHWNLLSIPAIFAEAHFFKFTRRHENTSIISYLWTFFIMDLLLCYSSWKKWLTFRPSNGWDVSRWWMFGKLYSYARWTCTLVIWM